MTGVLVLGAPLFALGMYIVLCGKRRNEKISAWESYKVRISKGAADTHARDAYDKRMEKCTKS